MILLKEFLYLFFKYILVINCVYLLIKDIRDYLSCIVKFKVLFEILEFNILVKEYADEID